LKFQNDDDEDDDDDEVGASLMNIIDGDDSYEEEDESQEPFSSSDQVNESNLRRYLEHYSFWKSNGLMNRLIPQDVNITFMDDNEDYANEIQDAEPSSDEMDDS